MTGSGEGCTGGEYNGVGIDNEDGGPELGLKLLSTWLGNMDSSLQILGNDGRVLLK